jgi:hypothetical protein
MSEEENKTEEAELEEALETTATPEAPAETPEPAADPAPAADDPADEPPVEAAAKPTPARKSRTQAQKDKRKADTARRKQAIADAPRAPDPSKEDAAEQKRKADIRAKMAETQGEIDELDAATEEKKDELRALSGELYPHLGASDHHTVAVAGYIASQKNLRATRASSPETLKRMLAQAGKAPIDAAMSRKNGRGTARPTGPGVTPTPAATE